MSGSELLDRVRCWFGGHRGDAAKPISADAGPWPAIGRPDAGAALLFASSGSGGASARSAAVLDAAPDAPEAPKPLPKPPPEPQPLRDLPSVTALAARPTDLKESPQADPDDAAILLRDLPDRIARSMARAGADLQSLREMSGELKGHHELSRSIAHAVGRLPDLAGTQAELVRRTNHLMERHTRVAEGMLDEMAALRGAFRSVDESSRRNLQCLSEIEASHREVIHQYQDILLAQHRRLGRLALVAILLAATALAGVAYVLNVALNR